MCYADAAGEKHDGAVRGECRGVAVGAFDEGGKGDASGWSRESFAVEVGGEAGAAVNDEGDGCLGEGETVVSWEGVFGFFLEVAGT